MFPIVGIVAVALLGLPQLAFALLGGFLSRGSGSPSLAAHRLQA
jgi:hypothetical protein